MTKKRITTGICILFAIIVCFALYNMLFPADFKVSDDEIALRVKLDLSEDVGLIVYDYEIDGNIGGGGMSNADRSLIKRDEELILTWNREELKEHDLIREIDSDHFPIRMRFRIITEYVDPNFDNAYEEDITRYLEPIEWEAYFGKEYKFRITGDKTNGYSIVME